MCDECDEYVTDSDVVYVRPDIDMDFFREMQQQGRTGDVWIAPMFSIKEDLGWSGPYTPEQHKFCSKCWIANQLVFCVQSFPDCPETGEIPRYL